MFPETRLHPHHLIDSQTLITTQAAKRANAVGAEIEKNRLAGEFGNASEASMAGEIWGMLESGELTNAANMTDERQAVSVVAWLCSL